MSSSDGIDVAMISSIRVAPQATRAGGSARAAETAELAGRFTAMLESLNGVSARAANDEIDGGTAASAGVSGSSSDRPVALGAVSLLALNEVGAGDDGRSSVATLAASDTAIDARWLATLQNDASVDEKDIAAD